MQVIYHLGAHRTDEDRIVKCLLKNRGRLSAAGTIVPGPGRYRQVLSQSLVSLRGAPAPKDMQSMILDAVMDEDRADRLIFSHEFFICVPAKVVSDGGFYTRAAQKVAWLSNLFPQAEAEFYLAMRNPATLLQDLIPTIPGASYESVMEDMDPLRLRWLHVIQQIVAQNPGVRLTVWCNEDTPLIWSELLHRIAGVPTDFGMEGDLDFPASLMTPDGAARLAGYLERDPPKSPAHRQRIIAAFLDKYGREDAAELALPLPGWTDALVARVSDQYDADAAQIAAMPEVSFIGV